MGPRRVTIGSLSDELERAGAFDPVESLDAERSRTGHARPGKETRLSRPLRLLLVVAVVLLCLFVVVAASIRMLVDPDEVAAWIAPRASSALQRDVTLGGATITLVPRPGLRVSDVRVANLEGYEGPALASIDWVRFDISILPLFLGRVNVARAHVEGARVHLGVDERGVSNFGDLVPESPASPTEAPAPVSFGLHEISFEDATLTYFDSPGERSFAVAGTSGALGVDADGEGGWIVDGTGAADSLHVRAPRWNEEILRAGGPNFSLSVRGDRTFDWIEIERGAVEQFGESLAVSGRIAGLTASDPGVDLRFTNPSLGAGALSAFISSATRSGALTRAEGTLDVALRLRGPLGGEVGPSLNGTVRLVDAGVRLNGGSLLAGVVGTIELDRDTLRLDSLSGTFADGPFTLSGSIVKDGHALALVIEASPDLDAIDRLGLGPGGSTLAGQTTLAVAMVGSLDALDQLAMTGTAQVTGVRFEHPRLGVPLYVPAAELEMADGDLRWGELTLLVGEEPLRTSGRLRGAVAFWLGDVTPVVEASLSGDRLALGSVLPDDGSGPDATYAQIAFAHLGRRDVEGMRATAAGSAAGYRRPRALPVHGSVTLGLRDLSYRHFELGNVSATVELSDSTLAIRDAAFDAWGGRVRGSLDLGVGDRLDEPFTLLLEGDGLAATPFLSAMTPLGDAVSGELELDVELSGTTDLGLLPVLESLHARGIVTVTEGLVAETGLNLALADFLADDAWAAVRFSTWTTQLGISESAIHVSESDLVSDLGRTTLSGVVGLDGAVDLAMGISIPAERLRAVSLRRTGVAQSVLDHLRASGNSLDLGIRVSGSLGGPTLEPDALAASEQMVRR